MTGEIYLGQSVESLEITPRFAAYTGVSVKADSNSEPFTAGDATGRVLEVTCMYASQTVADNILSQIEGYSYQPFSAGGALVEPAAEIGDAVTVGSVYGGLFSQNTNLGHLSNSDISSPTDEELAHEFGYIGEDGKYATYASLANGTASINGAGLQNGSVTGGKVAGRTLHDTNVAYNTLGSGELSGGVTTMLDNGQYAFDGVHGAHSGLSIEEGVILEADTISAQSTLLFWGNYVRVALPANLPSSAHVLYY